MKTQTKDAIKQEINELAYEIRSRQIHIQIRRGTADQFDQIIWRTQKLLALLKELRDRTV